MFIHCKTEVQNVARACTIISNAILSQSYAGCHVVNIHWVFRLVNTSTGVNETNFLSLCNVIAGLGASRTLSCTGSKLPGARSVSLRVHRAQQSEKKYEKYLSYMMMQFGQFLAHDFVLTETFTREYTTNIS